MWKRIEYGEHKMNKKIGFIKWGAIIPLTVLVIPSLILSLFVLPVEMIALNIDSYFGLLENEQTLNQMPPVISEVLVENVLFVGDIPPVLQAKPNFKSVMTKYFPEKWVAGMMMQLTSKTLDYVNFKTPYTAIEIEIADLKESIVLNAEPIADDYVLTLETCSSEENEIAAAADSINAYPQCKPDEALRADLSLEIGQYLGDKTQQLPDSINLVGLIPTDLQLGGRVFYWYSIIRWVFRLLPFITIILLILLAYTLRSDRKTMRRWIGRLLVYVTAIMIVFAVIILIGLDQFLGMIFSQPFSMLIAGFGNVLLFMTREIVQKVLIWVVAESTIIFFFGLILVLAAKYTKTKKATPAEDLTEVVEVPEDKSEKTIIPETLEEIEEEERKKDSSG